MAGSWSRAAPAGTAPHLTPGAGGCGPIPTWMPSLGPLGVILDTCRGNHHDKNASRLCLGRRRPASQWTFPAERLHRPAISLAVRIQCEKGYREMLMAEWPVQQWAHAHARPAHAVQKVVLLIALVLLAAKLHLYSVRSIVYPYCTRIGKLRRPVGLLSPRFDFLPFRR